MTGTPEFSVLIVNYNGGRFLQGALDSLKRQTHQDFEVILVDNASADGSADALDTGGLPAFTLLRQTENLGFARANNLGSETARGRWLALLNPDTEADPGWLAALSAAAARHPGRRTFASAQLKLGDETVLDGAGDAYSLFGFPWRGGFGRAAGDLPSADGLCFSACGASAMYAADLFRELGGFDERFFCYCEDVDLGFRLQLAGEDCVFVPSAVVRHAGSGIAGQASPFATYHGTRNRVWTYAKNMPLALLLPTLPGHIALTLYVLARNAFTPRFQPMLRGLTDGVLGLPKITGSPLWREPARTIHLWTLARRMAWNPWKMSQRKAHVRPLQEP